MHRLYSHKNPAIVTKWNEWKTINIKTKGGFYSFPWKLTLNVLNGMYQTNPLDNSCCSQNIYDMHISLT